MMPITDFRLLVVDPAAERWSSLRSWAMRIAKRRSVKAAKVALARKLAVVMHRMWSNGTDFRWSDAEASAGAV